MSETEINKMKVVLLALWDNQSHPEAQEIVVQFRKDVDEIQRGN